MKKLVTLIATFAICFSLGTVVMASPSSPTANDPTTDVDGGSGNGSNGTGSNGFNNSNDSSSTNVGDTSSVGGAGVGTGAGAGNGDGSSSPKTSDSYVVPGLVTVALGGTVVSFVSKKKMNSEK